MKVKELIKLIETVTVSGKLNVDVPPGTLNSALKQTGLIVNAKNKKLS